MDVKSYSRLAQADPSLVMDCPVWVLNPISRKTAGRILDLGIYEVKSFNLESWSLN